MSGAVLWKKCTKRKESLENEQENVKYETREEMQTDSEYESKHSVTIKAENRVNDSDEEDVDR